MVHQDNNGAAGANGANRTSGISGTSGSSGTAGTNGTTGPGGGSGAAGSSGTSGTAGTSGISGNVGSSGTYVNVTGGGGLTGGGSLINDQQIELEQGSLSGNNGVLTWDGSVLIETDLLASSPTNFDGQFVVDLQNLNNFSAATKSFDIEHPTKGNPHRLQYGVLEGPEHGVYLRGTTNEKTIKLPDYWVDLVHADSITVHLTPIGNACIHYVVSVLNNEINIDCECGDIKTYYTIYAERKDVNAPKIEYINE
jgi:hypothetical protein